MSRRIKDPAPLNAATFEQHYRNNTAKMLVLNVPAMRYSSCCGRQRTARQFIPSSPFCENCRRPR